MHVTPTAEKKRDERNGNNAAERSKMDDRKIEVNSN